MYGELIFLNGYERCRVGIGDRTYRRLHQTFTEYARVVTSALNSSVRELTEENHDADARGVYSCIAPKQSRVLERKPVLESNVAGNAIG